MLDEAPDATVRGLSVVPSQAARGEAEVQRAAAGCGAVNEWQTMVRDFNVKFGATVGNTPAIRDPELRAALIEEEAQETIDAIKAGDLVGAVDGICDLIYVAVGAAVAFGVELAPVFAEVHRTNMAKAGGATRADGKILKPDGWTPPRIAELLEDQTRKITIKRSGWHDTEVSARVIAEILAVHPGINDPWTLTHVPTGLAIFHTDERDDAIKVGRTLAAMSMESWRSDDPKAVADGTPRPVRDWLRELDTRRGFVPFPDATAA